MVNGTYYWQVEIISYREAHLEKAEAVDGILNAIKFPKPKFPPLDLSIPADATESEVKDEKGNVKWKIPAGWESEEQTAQVIVKLSEAVVEAAKLVATVSTRFPAADPLEEKEPPRTFETVFDPSDAKAESDINEQLALTAFKEYQIKVDRPVAPEGKLAFPVDAIVHRRAGVVTIHLLKTVESERKAAVSVLGEQFVIPNVGPVTVIPMEAGPFVKTEYDLKFEDGLLTEMHATRPSELLAIVQIIPDTLKTIASIPAELVQVKVDYSTRAKSLLDARKSIIDAQKGLLEKQGELIDAQRALLEKQREGETSDDNDARNDPNE